MTREYDRRIIFLLVVTAIILIAGIGMRDPWPADEPRYALIAQEMAEGGNWLIPHVGGVLYPDKPPMFFWLVAALYTLTGSIKVSILLPGLIAGIGVMWLVTDLSRRLWDDGTAVWAGAALLVMFQFPYQMKMGQIDGLLCLWTSIGLYGLSRHLLVGPNWGWYTLAGLSCGLGVITKGVGFLPLLILVPYCVMRRRGWPVPKLRSRDWRWLLAPLAFTLAIGAWLVPMLVVTDGDIGSELAAYRDNILFHQTVTRYADSWGHVKPPWYLFTNAIPWLWFPVTLLLPWLIPAWSKDYRNRHPAVILLGAWVLLLLLFFSLSEGKRSLYIFPAAPAIAMIAGCHARDILRRTGPRRMLLAAALFVAAALAAIGAYVLMNPEALQQWITAELSITAWELIAMATVMLMICAVAGIRYAPAGLAGTMAAFWIGTSMFIYPAINDDRSGKFVIDQVSAVTPAGYTLGLADWPEQFLLQWDGPAVHFGYRRSDKVGESHDAATWVSRSLDRRLLLSERMIEPCFDASRLVALGRAHRRNWYLGRENSLTPECRHIDEPIEQIVFYHPQKQLALLISRTPSSIYRQARIFE